MPFKHKNIEYGLPHEEYPKENVDQYMEELKKVIGLEKEPVAITFLFKKEDFLPEILSSASLFCRFFKNI